MEKENLLKTKREIVSHVEDCFIKALRTWRGTKSQRDKEVIDLYWTLLEKMGHADQKKAALIIKSFNSN